MENLVFSVLIRNALYDIFGNLRNLGICDTYQARELFGNCIGLLAAVDTGHRHRIELD